MGEIGTTLTPATPCRAFEPCRSDLKAG